jgi:GTPase
VSPDVSGYRFGELPPEHRSGFVAVLGRPNVGKSTLVNCLVGRKVSIVSDRPQTTRRRIAGVVTHPEYQLVLLDLPGSQRPFDELTRRMQHHVEEALDEVDAALVVLNAAETIGGGDRYILAAAAGSGTPFLVVLNKRDLIDGRQLQGATAEAMKLAGGAPLVDISATKGTNVDRLLAELVEHLPRGPRYFPEQTVSDQPLEVLVAELVREQVLRRTRDEVPHAVAVQVEEIVERDDRPLVEITATIVVETESQKAIVIGKGGALVKRIGSAARQEIEAIVGAQVFLSLRVKVRRKWRRDPSLVDRLV